MPSIPPQPADLVSDFPSNPIFDLQQKSDQRPLTKPMFTLAVGILNVCACHLEISYVDDHQCLNINGKKAMFNDGGTPTQN